MGAAASLQRLSRYGICMSGKETTVLVLLSTWNGSEFLRQQVRSILSQHVEGGTVGLLVRDDGSQDDTVPILRSLQGPRVELLIGSNIGAKESYLTLAGFARERKPDLVVLADQDDVWLPGKLQRAADQLRGIEGPALYCSALELVDARLRPLGTYCFPGKPSFKGAFLANCATGCTCVLNRAAVALLEPKPNADEILMHDWWLYLVVSAFGRMIYDNESRVLYRQHGGNQVGRSLGGRALIARGLKFLKRPFRPNRLTQAAEFRRLYAERLAPQQLQYVDSLLACAGRPIRRALFAASSFLQHDHGMDEAIGLASFVLEG